MTFQEYDDDDIASDSDDQKKIRSAESRALRKLGRYRPPVRQFFPSASSSVSSNNVTSWASGGVNNMFRQKFQTGDRNIF